jgi:hypothetical protein
MGYASLYIQNKTAAAAAAGKDAGDDDSSKHGRRNTHTHTNTNNANSQPYANTSELTAHYAFGRRDTGMAGRGGGDILMSGRARDLSPPGAGKYGNIHVKTLVDMYIPS